MSLSIRSQILSEARSWIGTPYRHHASLKGVGTDCLGLLRGVWRNVIGPEPADIPPYSPDWAEQGDEDMLMVAARQFLHEAPMGGAKPGDVLLFRMALAAPSKHCAIVSSKDRIIHAYWGRSVTETALVPWWERRIAGRFAFPGTKEN